MHAAARPFATAHMLIEAQKWVAEKFPYFNRCAASRPRSSSFFFSTSTTSLDLCTGVCGVSPCYRSTAHLCGVSLY